VTAERQELRAIPISGLSPDSLGNYLASLGLLRLLVRKWPSVRMAWHDDVLHVLGGPSTLDELLDEIMSVAAKGAWTKYDRGWAGAQKQSSALVANKKTSGQSGLPFAVWQAEAEEDVLELFAAHVVPNLAGRSFNPVLGRAGKIGQRDFAAGLARAVAALAPPSPSTPGKKETPQKTATRLKANAEKTLTEADRKRNELALLFSGGAIAWMEKDLNAACWFSSANKLYNNGQETFRDGLLSPWAMALACEGLAFLAGGASRRLAARARTVGAFPFVTKSAAPTSSGEAGRDSAEFWAPLWDRPMAVPEVTALFRRGRAELRGRVALTPSAFATAILRRGVDAGVTEFRRFVLGRTTAQDYVEPRFEGTFRLPAINDARPSSPLSATSATVVATALERVTALIEQPRFPRDRKIGQRWRVAGLRGPIEAAALRVAAALDDPEAALAMLDAVVESLDRVDRNRSFREARVSWEPLPIEWLPSLFADDQPETEARLALALVSGFPLSRPLTLYRFGVEWSYGRFEHVERAPARWVWGPGDLPRVLSVVLARRTLDWESARKEQRRDEDPVRVVMPATCLHISRWLDGAVDERLLAKWISRLALFDWRTVPHEVRALAQPSPDRPGAEGALCLFGLFQPLFDRHPLRVRGVSSPRDLLDPKSGARTPAAARMLVSLLRAGHIDAAVRLASSRYAMAGTFLARTSSPWGVGEPERLLASILFSIPGGERAALNERWLRPRRRQGDQAHA
jgi:CRISPR-associated protein Csx17